MQSLACLVVVAEVSIVWGRCSWWVCLVVVGEAAWRRGMRHGVYLLLH
jgi:hypothetical protein